MTVPPSDPAGYGSGGVSGPGDLPRIPVPSPGDEADGRARARRIAAVEALYEAEIAEMKDRHDAERRALLDRFTHAFREARAGRATGESETDKGVT